MEKSLEKMMNKLEKVLLPIANKLTSTKWLMAVKDTMITAMPFLIVGSVFLLLAYLPIPGYEGFITGIFGEGWQEKITLITGATFGIIALIVLVGTAYFYSRELGVDSILSIVLSIAVLFILTPVKDGNISLQWLGTQGMLVNILIGLSVTRLYKFILGLNIAPKMPDGVPPGVIKSFAALVPIFVIAVLFLVIRLLIGFTPFESIQELIFKMFQIPLQKLGGNLFSMILVEMLGQLLWFFGLHGNAIVSGVMDPIWYALSAENLSAFQGHTELVNIVTKQFKEVFLQIGGSGSTLPLVFLLATSKSKQLKTLGLLALPAGLFNINEPVIFGLPIVLSPVLFIPWILTTPILAGVTYFSMWSGLVPYTSGVAIPWTTPTIISGALVSGPKGAILQVVLIIISLVIYYPFFKMVEKQKLREESKLGKV